MRAELKAPLGTLYEGSPTENAARFGEAFDGEGRPMLASVGDFVSRNFVESGLDPDIIVVDGRIMRTDVEPLSLGDRMIIRTRNPPGTIDADAWRALGEAVTLKKGVAVIVEGEEDLLVLPLMILMPAGSLIVYGQPGVGLVVVEATEERRAWARVFMARMERS